MRGECSARKDKLLACIPMRGWEEETGQGVMPDPPVAFAPDYRE